MQKGTNGDIAVAVTRLGSDPVPVTVPKGSTVEDALKKANIAVNTKAEYFVDGERANLGDIVEEGDVLNVVTPKQAGA